MRLSVKFIDQSGYMHTQHRAKFVRLWFDGARTPPGNGDGKDKHHPPPGPSHLAGIFLGGVGVKHQQVDTGVVDTGQGILEHLEPFHGKRAPRRWPPRGGGAK